MNYLEKNKLTRLVMENSLKNNRLILKSQQRFTSQKHNVFIEEASANNDKII